MYSILQSKYKGLKSEAAAFTRELIKCYSPSFREQDIARLVRKYMNKYGYDKVIQDDSGNIIGIIYGREHKPTLLLNSHMDTVLPADKGKWHHSPWGAQEDQGKLYGCGASDCRAGLACQLFAGALLKRSLLPFKGNLVVAATVGEETGFSSGVRALLERTLPELELMPDYALLGEPTELGLYYGHDGWIDMDVKVQGHNVLDVDDAAGMIYRDFNFRNQNDTAAKPESFHSQSPVYQSNDSQRRACINLTRRFNIREKPEDLLLQTRNEALLAVQTVNNVAVAVDVHREHHNMYTGRDCTVTKVTHAWSVDPFSVLMERSRHALQAAGLECRTGKWHLNRAGMATAGGVLVNEYDVSTIGYGPGTEDVIHGPDEYVKLNNIHTAVYGTASIIHNLIGIPVFGWTIGSL